MARYQAYQDGIIPAHAGNTTPIITAGSTQRDHPRTCGEHEGSTIIFALNPGSSPHMRGTQNSEKGDINDLGIIPAHAGNTPAHPQHPEG